MNVPSTEVKATGPAELSPVERMFSSVMAAVQSPDVDPAKARELIELQERLIDRQAKTDFQRAKLQAMSEMPYIDRDGAIKNKAGEVQSRYANFETIDRIVRPVCNRHGLAYSFQIGSTANSVPTVNCRLEGFGHEEQSGFMICPLDQSGSKNAIQGAGSSVAYGKRYTLCAILNIVTNGDDRNGAAVTTVVVPGMAEDWQTELLDLAQIAASKGLRSYEDFAKGRSNMERGWLIDAGHHKNLKLAAEANGP